MVIIVNPSGCPLQPGGLMGTDGVPLSQEKMGSR